MKYTESEAILAARRRRGPDHVLGICSWPAALCGDCYRELHDEMLDWARQRPDPETGEDVVTYWRRIGGRMLDPWYSVARERGALPPLPGWFHRDDLGLPACLACRAVKVDPDWGWAYRFTHSCEVYA